METVHGWGWRVDDDRMMSHTLYDKLWNSHVVATVEDGRTLLYVDRHLVNEVTSPQAFEGLRIAGHRVWRSDTIIATADHATPTDPDTDDIADPLAFEQVATLDRNVAAAGARSYFPFRDPAQGIIHVVAPELGATQPGMTIVCGDSHTSTHGAFAALAFGIGTSDVEHVLATQTIAVGRSRTMLVELTGTLPPFVGAKDVVLALIGRIGTAGGVGHVIEYAGEAVRAMSMEARMTLCNMAIEAGARSGMVAVDDTTLRYLRGRPQAPAGESWDRAAAQWRTLRSDTDARFDAVVHFAVDALEPQVTWGTSPEMVVPISGRVPDPADARDPDRRAAWARALDYMALEPGTPMRDIAIDRVFIGSCTNARIEDLRAAASVLRGRRVAARLTQALVVPGSGGVRAQAEAEGLDRVFRDAGVEWRMPGCSMCLGMNDDRLRPGERCASTSNRNFEGRQGAGGRSHLMSPSMAAAAAISGALADVRDLA